MRQKWCISRGEARLDSEGIEAGGGQGESHSATLRCNGGSHSGGSHSGTGRDATEGQIQELELPRALNLERESSEHLRWAHLEQVHHCTDLPQQVTFPVHTE